MCNYFSYLPHCIYNIICILLCKHSLYINQHLTKLMQICVLDFYKTFNTPFTVHQYLSTDVIRSRTKFFFFYKILFFNYKIKLMFNMPSIFTIENIISNVLVSSFLKVILLQPIYLNT